MTFLVYLMWHVSLNGALTPYPKILSKKSILGISLEKNLGNPTDKKHHVTDLILYRNTCEYFHKF